MVRVKVVEWVKLPLVPVMVKVRVPVAALFATFTVRVEVPDPVTEVGLKVVVTRAPCPVAVRLTVPVNPFTAPMVTVVEPLAPRRTVMLAGESEMVKFGAGAGLTVRLTVVECDKLPLAPVTVKVNVPVVVLVLVVIDKVLEPDPVTEVGLKLALAPLGNPLTLKPTAPANPPDPVIVVV